MRHCVGWLIFAVVAFGCGGLPPQPAAHVQLDSGDVPVVAGADQNVCVFLNLPGIDPLNVVRFAQQNQGFVRHLILYQSGLPHSPGVGACPDAIATDGSFPVYPAVPPALGPEPLPDGTVFHFDAQQAMILLLHVVNTTSAAAVEHVVVDMTLADPNQTYTRAGVSIATNVSFTIPAYSAYSSTTRCMICLPDDFHVFGFASYARSRLTDVTVTMTDPTTLMSTMVYENTDAAHPAIEMLATPLHAPPRASWTYTCTWQNNDPTPVSGGMASTDEICEHYVFYYPSLLGIGHCYAY